MRRSRLLAILTPLLLITCGCATNGNLGPSTEFRLRNLEAKFLELEKRQQELEQSAFRRIGELEAKLAELGQPMAPAPQVATPPPPPPPPPPEPPAPVKKKVAKPKPATKKPSPPAPAPAPRETVKASAPASPPSQASAVSSLKGNALYDEALLQVRQKNTIKGREMFLQFVRENPKSSLLPNALYWLGETWYHEQEYGEAILSFKDVAGRFPDHNKAPAAMLKIGYCYERLNDTNNARFYLQALIDEYPKSEPARLARKNLEKLGGGQ